MALFTALAGLTLPVIPAAVVAVLLFMAGRHVLQKEQDRKDAEAAESAEEEPAAAEEPMQEAALEEGNVAEIVEAVLEAEEKAESA